MRKEIARPAANRFFTLEGLFLKLLIHGAWSLSIAAFKKLFRRVRDDLVSLSCDHINGGLDDDQLGGRRNKGNISQIFADPRDFFKDLIHSVQGSDVAK